VALSNGHHEVLRYPTAQSPLVQSFLQECANELRERQIRKLASVREHQELLHIAGQITALSAVLEAPASVDVIRERETTR